MSSKVSPDPAVNEARDQKFSRRKRQIIDTASLHINDLGVRGMTMAAVARDLAIDPSSLTYYFKKKDDLVAACLTRTLQVQRRVAILANQQTDLWAGLRFYIHNFVEAHRPLTQQRGGPLALLSDMVSLTGQHRQAVFDLYEENFEILRAFLAAAASDSEHSRERAMVVTATVQWLSGWITDYHPDDFARIETHLLDVLKNGIAIETPWNFDGAMPAEPDESEASTRFLLAATHLINREGYHGARVEKIAAELGVSTGSFYHHLDNKDDLVLACFERGHTLVNDTINQSATGGAGPAARLAQIVSGLIRFQLVADSPMLTASAYQALPPPLRRRALHRTAQMTSRIAGLVSDGIAAGTIRPIDPMIASHVIMALIGAAADLRQTSANGSMNEMTTVIAQIVSQGFFSSNG